MTTLAEAVNQMIEVIGRFRQLLTDLASWAMGTATGGPNADGNYPFKMPDGTTIPVPSPALLKVTAKSARDYSTDNWLYLSEPAERIQMALEAAFDDRKDVWIPRKETPYVFEHEGLYYPEEDGEWRRAMMKLRSGVSIRSNGATLKLTEGRTNPPGFFMQRYADDEILTDIDLIGLRFDGGWRQIDPNIIDLKERYSFDNYAQKVDTSSDTPWDVTQIAHAVSIWRGRNIRAAGCEFKRVLGYGLALGQTTWAGIAGITYPRYHGVENAQAWFNDFEDCYHGGVFLPTTWGGSSVQYNKARGDGYYVAFVDVERHHTNDETTDVTIAHNDVDFSGGYCPIAYGHDAKGNPIPDAYGRTFLARYRRAVSLGSFQPTTTALSRGHNVLYNRVRQGMLECYGHRDTIVHGNDIETLIYEDLSEAEEYPAYFNLITPHAIRFYANNNADDLSGCRITGNKVKADIAGYGGHIYRYENIVERDNQIEGPRSGAWRLQHTSGQYGGGKVKNIGLEAAPAPVYQLEGGRGPVIITAPNVEDNRVVVIPGPGPTDPPAAIIPHYGTASLARLVGAMSQPVKITGYSGFRDFTSDKMFETESQNAARLEEWGNGNGGFQTPGIQVGDGTGSLAQHFVSGIDQAAFIDFWNGSFEQPRLFVGVPAGDRYGFVMLAFKPSGTADLVAQFNGVTRAWNFLAGRFNIRGDWQNPLGFVGGRKLWMDADGMMKLNFTDPTWGGDGDTVMLKVPVPSAYNAPGLPGMYAVGGGWEYTCTAKDTWVRKSVGSTW
ncbi:hypothetical protein [Sphingobium olei]|uniref:Right-handed parallel beta-helix repeat-containing protein n=1 Tax=Sphingobium olei TaxID=420955 RepID=A0ABW3NTH9_9SPHN